MAFSGSMRSSVYGVCRRPYSLPRQCHELPHAAGRRAGHGARDETRFRLGQVNQLLGHALFIQNALDHGPIAAGALEAATRVLWPRLEK